MSPGESLTPAAMMSLIAAGVVGSVFVYSSALKWRDTGATLSAMSDLRVAKLLGKPILARSLPIFELVMALGITLGSGVVLLTAISLLVLALTYFTFLLVGVLRRDEDVSCNCFGTSSSATRVSWLSVMRNLGLLTLTLVVGLDTNSKVATLVLIYQHDTLALHRVLMVWLVALLGFLFYRLHAVKQKNVSSPKVPTPAALPTNIPAVLGDPIPDVEVVNGHGISVGLPRLGRGRPTLLVFLSAECGSCAATAERIHEWSLRLSPVVLRVITSSRPEDIQRNLGPALPLARYGSKSSVAALGVVSLPAAVILGSRDQPVVASDVVYGHSDIERLVDSMLSSNQASGVTSVH